MKILVIPFSYPDQDTPNITPFIHVHTLALKKLGNQIDVLHVKLLPLRKWFVKNTHIYEQNTIDSINKYSIYMRYLHGFNPINTYIFSIKANKLYKHYTKENGSPDVILSHFYRYSGVAAAKIAKKNSIPLLHIEHAGWLLNDSLSKYERICLNTVIKESKKCICVSPALKESITCKVNLSQNLVVIPNIINPIYHYYENVEKEKYVFFSAGNLYEGKRFPLLIQAFCNVFSKNDNVELRIAGEGHLRETIKNLICANGRKHQIIMLGSLNSTDMLNEYIYCDSFVLPSEHESFGIVYREALSVGRPIITTNHQGFQHDWSNTYGIRIEIDNQVQLESALQFMKEHSNEYDGKSISQKCQAQYSESSVISQYLKIFNTL